MLPLGVARGENDSPGLRLVAAARALANKPTTYDPKYVRLAYPGGDPGENVGVCTDLVVRAYRGIGVDLQKLVYEDMRKNFRAYPARRKYGQSRPDRNIDHRRVPNLMVFFKRNGQSLPPDTADLKEWRPGDIVVWDLFGNGVPSHIGIISDRKGPSGKPLVFHHFPPFPSEDDCLETWEIIGHFRYFP